MTQPNDNHRRDHGSWSGATDPPGDPPPVAAAPRAAAERERIAAELAALGEEPADDDELGFAWRSSEGAWAGPLAGAPVQSDHASTVTTVATLVGLSRWSAPAEGLLPLERHRVWQRIATRVPSPVTDPEQPAANDGGVAGWRGVVASLALVAGVTLMLHVDVAPPPSAEDRAALLDLGEATRAVLEGTLPGEQDGTRARELADGYAARLQAARGATP